MSDNNESVSGLGSALHPDKTGVLHEFARAVELCHKKNNEQRRLAAMRRNYPHFNGPLPESTAEVVYRAQLRNFYNTLQEMNVNFESELDEEMALIEEEFNARHGIIAQERIKKVETPENEEKTEKEGIYEKKGTPDKAIEDVQESVMDESPSPDESVGHQNDFNDISAIEMLLRSLSSEPNEDYEFAYQVLDDLDTIDKN